MVLEVAVVAEDERRAAVGAEDHVEVAVAVEVGVGDSAADERLEQVLAGGCVRSPARSGRSRPVFQKSWAGWAYLSPARDLGDLRLDVAVAGQQVEPAVEVVVEEERAELERRPARPGQAVGQRRVREEQVSGWSGFFGSGAGT